MRATRRRAVWTVAALATLAITLVLSPAFAEKPAPKPAPAPAPAPSPSAAKPKGTIVVPASVVARAIDKKDVSATNAVGPDGKPAGAKLVGVGKYKTGLKDGDIVIAVGGSPTPTVDTMVGVAIGAYASGADKLTGTIRRGEDTWSVVLEIPKR
jgi:hypothetical protein